MMFNKVKKYIISIFKKREPTMQELIEELIAFYDKVPEKYSFSCFLHRVRKSDLPKSFVKHSSQENCYVYPGNDISNDITVFV